MRRTDEGVEAECDHCGKTIRATCGLELCGLVWCRKPLELPSLRGVFGGWRCTLSDPLIHGGWSLGVLDQIHTALDITIRKHKHGRVTVMGTESASANGGPIFRVRRTIKLCRPKGRRQTHENRIDYIRPEGWQQCHCSAFVEVYPRSLAGLSH